MIDAERAMARIQAQHALGPRFAGSPGHRRAQELLASWLQGADRAWEHSFSESFFGETVTCRNLGGTFDGSRPGRILLGTHYDTRPWADRDPEEAQRKEPVPGANDGGSGVALLAELACDLLERRERPTVDIVLFDAEDWHEIDGKEVSLGARRFADHLDDLDESKQPDEVLILDMIAGRNLMLDVDVNCQMHDASFTLTLQLFQLGHALGLPAFALDKDHPYKWIGCDHSPFVLKGIPSAILIDIDYPPWHTVRDLPEECDAESLRQIGAVVEAYIFREP
ncbi:MAG: M28 family peptidase [Myxococcota bacterium]